MTSEWKSHRRIRLEKRALANQDAEKILIAVCFREGQKNSQDKETWLNGSMELIVVS